MNEAYINKLARLEALITEREALVTERKGILAENDHRIIDLGGGPMYCEHAFIDLTAKFRALAERMRTEV